eukprot:m.256634 g.256634  ORF g.256634 m.256634 type:complete len:239 (-) comp11019_c0_seq2:49-765(-)
MPKRDEPDESELGELAPEWPFRGYVFGASGSGKTYWTATELLMKGYPTVHVLWVAPALSLRQDLVRTVLPEFFGERFETIEADKGFTDEVQSRIISRMEQNKSRKQRLLVVLDDMMSSHQGKGGGLFTQHLYTTSRHTKSSVIMLEQRIFNGNKSSRSARINCCWMAVFRFPGAANEMAQLLAQVESDKKARAAYLEAYKQATADRKKYGYVFLDLLRPEGDPLRYRDSSWDVGILIE